MPLLAPVMFPPPRAALRVIQRVGDDLRTIEGPEAVLVAHAGMQDHEVRLRAMTRMLIRRHREAIEQLAQKLLRETTLSGPELDELVEQYRTR